MVFELIGRYQLRMNPLKCSFGVTSGKFLVFIVRYRGIEIDQAKVDAISKMPEPRNIHELKSLQGKLAYLRRFISNLAGRCQPFSHLMKKGSPFNWDQTCSDDFKSIKLYLAKPPVLAAPIPGKPLIFYIAGQERCDVHRKSPLWKMYFDGATHRGGAGAGVVFITSQEDILPFSFTLKQCCSNNVAEYHVLILGLEMVVDMKQLHLQVFGDSQLVINQLLGSYEVKKPELRPYHDYAQNFIGCLGYVTLQHVRRTENKRDDTLAALVPPINEEKYIENEFEHVVAIFEAAEEDWRQSIIDYMCYGILQKYPKRRTDIRRRAPRFLYYKDTLFKRSFEGLLLRCLGKEEAIQALQEAHSEKWAEVVALTKVKKKNIADFIGVNIIYSFGIPRYIIKDNNKQFNDKLMNKICDLFDFKQHKSSMYHAATNGLAKAFNKTLCNPLKKVVSKSKRDWHERMEEALWKGSCEEENARLRLAELEALDEKRLEAQQNLECYQARLSRAFNKKFSLRCFQVGDQVLAVRIPIISSHNSGDKFTSKWDGPYVVK
ncbi:uncharacterized protein LOC107022103 [Solanum pennellii]|uniref:Uncharacterized protein LOC107022103 n=1 Tax=Solanum pennellii TaxID=28526 RepID=A0ABM1GZS6_SOLPN|nr:uncharacterized protein LOC107022103 [Solanum pennellii]